jgi:two-component system, OmpR family, response regulator
MPETILVVDDDPDIARFVEVNLRSAGYDVAVAGDGEEALERAGELRPDLVLLDVMMPGLDGPATLEALRRLPAAAGTPVVFMTARVQAHEIARYRELGAADVIAKPFDPMTLADTVQSIWRSLHP